MTPGLERLLPIGGLGRLELTRAARPDVVIAGKLTRFRSYDD